MPADKTVQQPWFETQRIRDDLYCMSFRRVNNFRPGGIVRSWVGKAGLLIGLLIGPVSLLFPGNAVAIEPGKGEQVSFRCALAIDAVLARLDEQTENPVIKQALDRIDEDNGQLVCISMSSREIQVRLQASDMTAADNRLVFSLDAKTYKVLKIYYGR